MTLEKDKTILDLVEALDLERRGWMVVDHWEADLCAIGIGMVTDPRRLVYVSTFNRRPGRYDYECELPDGEAPEEYSTPATGEEVEYEILLKIMEAHLKR
jgi:hypothetical protein